MFNFFKKATQPNNEVIVERKYPDVVYEIHHEFETAGDKILEQANKILAECNAKDIDKGKRLSAIGFVNTPQAKVAVETEQKIALSKEQAELATYYKINYPSNKFITEEQVKAICEKYSLVCGDISAYKGFVPENKLIQIEAFNVNKKDLPFVSLFGSKYKISGHSETIQDLFLGNISGEDIIDDWAVGRIKCGENFWAWGTFLIGSSDIKVSDRVKAMYDNQWEYVQARPFDSKLKICAPLKDMEVKSNQQVNGYKIQNIPDPVVLQPVNGGYLIVAAWGDEASDENVVNETMN